MNVVGFRKYAIELVKFLKNHVEKGDLQKIKNVNSVNYWWDYGEFD